MTENTVVFFKFCFALCVELQNSFKKVVQLNETFHASPLHNLHGCSVAHIQDVYSPVLFKKKKASSQAFKEANFLQTNGPSVLHCWYVSWGCFKFRDK